MPFSPVAYGFFDTFFHAISSGFWGLSNDMGGIYRTVYNLCSALNIDPRDVGATFLPPYNQAAGKAAYWCFYYYDRWLSDFKWNIEYDWDHWQGDHFMKFGSFYEPGGYLWEHWISDMFDAEKPLVTEP